MADRDLGHIQVKSGTAKEFKELRKKYVDKELGSLTNDQFMRKLLNLWKNQKKAKRAEGTSDKVVDLYTMKHVPGHFPEYSGDVAAEDNQQ